MQREIEATMDRLMADHADKVEQTKARSSLIGWWFGQVMKALDGKTNAIEAMPIIKQKLGLES